MPVIQGIPAFAQYAEQAVGGERNRYVNAGVLVMNMKMMREIRFSKQFLTLLNTWSFDAIAPGQDHINAMCYGRVRFLDECWNATAKPGGAELQFPKLIHYHMPQRPWFYDDVPYRDYFWKYARVSSFYPKIVQRREHYGTLERRLDQESMNYLLEKANAIPDGELDLRRAYEQEASICK